MIQRKYNLNACLAIMVACFIVALVVGALEKRFGIFDGADALAIRLTKSLRTTSLNVIMTGVTSLGNEMGSMVIVCIIFWLGYTTEFVMLLLMLLFGNTLNSYMKDFFELARPQPHEVSSVVDAEGYGYPSGHSQSGMLYSWLLYALIGRYWYICLLAALAMAASRIYLGVHYFSDTLGGLIMGFGLVVGAMGIYGHARELASLRESIRRSRLLKLALAVALSLVYLAVSWGTPDAVKYSGFLAGFFIVYPMLGFRWRSRNVFLTIAVIIVGLAVLLSLRVGLGLALPRTDPSNYVRYFVLGVVLALSPLLFTKTRLLKRVRS